MQTASATPPRSSSGPWLKWLAVGALVAGAFDITYAIVFSYLRRGTPPSRILQSVTSGVLGRAAYDGTRTAALGLGLHFLNAFIITTIFFLAARSWPALVRRPIAIGAAYGLLVYLVMNFVVIPLSAIGVFPRPAPVLWMTELSVHMFLVGVTIALAAHRAFAES
jgi:uncharacterized membrane protein YagU involved in acid resistance